MNEAQTITILLSLVATFFGLLVIMVGWMGNKMYNKLDEMASAMRSIETDLHGQIGSLDRRLVIVESKMLSK